MHRDIIRSLRRVGRALPHLFSLSRLIRETRGTAGSITLSGWFLQKIIGFNAAAYWPVSHLSTVLFPLRIRTGVGTAPGLSPGCYIQGKNGIEIGDYTLVGPNVGLISVNHDVEDPARHVESAPIVIGRCCWIGMNAVVLPSVNLGDHTVVGANSVVRTSFPDGYCVVAGSPARIVKRLNPDAVKESRNQPEYVGYYRLGDVTKEMLFERLKIEKLR